MTDPTKQPLVHTIPGAADVAVEHHTYGDGLAFDLYRPGRTPAGAVVFVTGYPEAMFGGSFKDWVSYQGWARMVAASGLVGILYSNRTPDDVHALLAHLRANAAALGIDPARLGVWAASGHVPMALDAIARGGIAFAALLYGYMLDCAEARAQFRFVAPDVDVRGLRADILVVRAGRDALPGIAASQDKFLALVPCTVIVHAEGAHAFDMVDDSPRTHEVIDEVLAWLRSRGA